MSSVPYFDARAWARSGLGQTEIDLIEFMWKRTGGTSGGDESFRILIEAVRVQLQDDINALSDRHDAEISDLSDRHDAEITDLDADIAALVADIADLHNRIDGLETATQPEMARRAIEIKKLRQRLEQLEALTF